MANAFFFLISVVICEGWPCGGGDSNGSRITGNLGVSPSGLLSCGKTSLPGWKAVSMGEGQLHGFSKLFFLWMFYKYLTEVFHRLEECLSVYLSK